MTEVVIPMDGANVLLNNEKSETYG